MDSENKLSRKFLVTTIIVNLAVIGISLTVSFLFGILPGVFTFTLMIILVPLTLHYLYFRRKYYSS